MINGIIMGMSSKLLILSGTLGWYFLHRFIRTNTVDINTGHKVMFSLRSKVKRFVDKNKFVYFALFDKIVMHVLSYGCEIWRFYPAKAIEQLGYT